MAGLDNHGHAHRVQRLLNAVANLHRQPLLHLQAAGKTLHHAGHLREARDVTVGDIGHMGLAVERQHVMLAKRVEFDVLDQHHLPVFFAERRRADDLERILVVTFRQERHGLSHAFGGLEQPFARGVFPQQAQDFRIMELQRLDGRRVETLLLVVILRFHRAQR